MGLLKRALGNVKETFIPVGRSSGMLRRLVGLPDERNYGGLVGDGSGNSIVVACLNWIATNFPEAPLAMWQKQPGASRERIEEHAMLDLLDEPNPFFDIVELLMGAVVSFNIDGNGYLVKRRDSLLRVTELWYAPHWMLEPKGRDGTRSSADFITHYDYWPTPGGKTQLAPSEVIHFRQGIDQENPRKGSSKLRGLLREIFTDEEAARFTAAILKNMGVPGLVFSPAGNLAIDPEDAKETVAAIEAKYGGDRRGGVLVMGSATKVDQFGFSPDQLKLGDIRDIPEERVTAALGIPAAVVGFGAGLQATKVGATMDALRDQAWQNNLIPTQRIFGAKLRQQLLPEYEPDARRRRSFVVGFDTSAVAIMADYQVKFAEKHERLVRAGVEQRAEARAALDLPIGPRDRVYLLNAGVLEVPADRLTPTPVATLDQLATVATAQVLAAQNGSR